MKTKINMVAIVLITVCAMARVTVPFQGWDRLKDSSPYIIIAQCGKQTPLVPNVITVGGTKYDSEIQVISFLKGTNTVGSARLQTDHQLWQGEYYLIFGYYDAGIYQAFEEYRVIHLGANFSTNIIAGKSLDEQIQKLLARSLFYLNRQINQEQEEKARLEQAFQK